MYWTTLLLRLPPATAAEAAVQAVHRYRLQFAQPPHRTAAGLLIWLTVMAGAHMHSVLWSARQPHGLLPRVHNLSKTPRTDRHQSKKRSETRPVWYSLGTARSRTGNWISSNSIDWCACSVFTSQLSPVLNYTVCWHKQQGARHLHRVFMKQRLAGSQLNANANTSPMPCSYATMSPHMTKTSSRKQVAKEGKYSIKQCSYTVDKKSEKC